jgi:hypothetical protein
MLFTPGGRHSFGKQIEAFRYFLSEVIKRIELMNSAGNRREYEVKAG